MRGMDKEAAPEKPIYTKVRQPEQLREQASRLLSIANRLEQERPAPEQARFDLNREQQA